MGKKWIILPILFLILLVFWQTGGLDSLLYDNDKEEVQLSSEDLDYEVDIIGEGLEIPWEIAPLSDGRFLITERPGRVIILDGGETYTVDGVEHIGEGGLLGIEISPDFSENKHLFLYYTYREEGQIYNRVSRFTFDENTLNNEIYILDKIPGSRFHNGGRLKFGLMKNFILLLETHKTPIWLRI